MFIFLLAPEEGLSFKPKYWANLFKDTFFVLLFCLLLHRLAVRICLPFYISTSYYCTDPGLQLGDRAPRNCLQLPLWTC